MKADDVRAILTALNGAQARYLIVGGLAVVAHGYVRYTQDVDIVLQLERDNILRAMNALTAIGYRPLVPVAATEFANAELRRSWREEKGMIVFQMLNLERESTRLDIFVTEPFAFDEELRCAKWHDYGEIRAPILRIEALIAMKEAAGRGQDLADASLLRDLLQIEEEDHRLS